MEQLRLMFHHYWLTLDTTKVFFYYSAIKCCWAFFAVRPCTSGGRWARACVASQRPTWPLRLWTTLSSKNYNGRSCKVTTYTHRHTHSKKKNTQIWYKSWCNDVQRRSELLQFQNGRHAWPPFCFKFQILKVESFVRHSNPFV